MTAGKDFTLDDTVVNGQPGHAVIHSDLAAQTNWLTGQVKDVIDGDAGDLADAIDERGAQVFVGSAKAADTYGGQHPKPFRVPALTVQREWPNQQQDYTIVWAQGLTAYAVAGDYSIRKTTDGGYSWTRKNTSALTVQLGYRGGFLKLATGTLLAWENGSAATPTIRRSTDDGVTWSSSRHTARTGLTILSSQSWCEDPNTGYIYYGEYDPTGTATEIRIYRSTDDGNSWSQFGTAWPGLGAGTLATQVKHVHACQYDSVSSKVYFWVGDVSLSAGLYRVNAGGTDVEAVLQNRQLTSQGVGSAGAATARAVGGMFFPTHIAWASDDLAGNFCRMARTQIGQASPVVEIVHTGLSSGWATCRAASDGSQWLAFTDSDGSGLDAAAHVYGVGDNGATIWEIGALPSDGISVAGALVPVGQAELHTDKTLWLATSFGATGNAGAADPWQGRCTLAKSSAPGLIGPRRRRKHQPPSTVSSGVITVSASGTTVFGGITAPPSPENLLYVLDWGIYRTSGTGVCALQIVTVSNSTNVLGNQGPTAQFRSGAKIEDEFAVAGLAVTGGTVVEFRVSEVGGSASATCNAWVTFAWGPKLIQSLF